MFLGVWHTSWTVADLERSIAFYTTVLELELVATQTQDNEYTRTFIGIPDAVLKVALFALPGIPAGPSRHILELVEYVVPRGVQLDLRTFNIGSAHLCFYTDKIHELFPKLVERGVVFRSPPVEITAGVNRGGYSSYFHDPDGVTLELLQPPPGRL
ncbi:hypothetical protein HC891_06095 [Candidatus Gracilibacteria bacterium]|nr:hypothetical protein [Candidatus Gracilibacteria bacterium]